MPGPAAAACRPVLAPILQPGPADRERLRRRPGRGGRREATEETDLQALAAHSAVAGEFDVDVHPIPEHGGEPAHLHHDVRFLFVARGELGGGEVAELSRVGLDDVLRRSDRPAMRRIVTKPRRLDG